MNVLLTCVGRRDYLVGHFRAAVGKGGRVFGVNSDEQTTGMTAVDRAYRVPRVDSPEYVPVLLKLCKRYRIGLLVSLFDADLPVIAAARDRFAEIGVTAAISDPWVIDVANDKWQTFRFLSEHGIGFPSSFLTLEDVGRALTKGDIAFPLIVKPRWGFGSLGLYIANDTDELGVFFRRVQKEVRESSLSVLSRLSLDHSVIVQEFVHGDEYGVDVFNSLEGNHLATVVKRKVAMRSGETDIAVTVKHRAVEALATRIGGLLRHRGNLDIDIITSSRTARPTVLELNARFGGGYPFSHLAGVDFPGALVRMARGQSIDPRSLRYRPGVLGMKSIVPIIAKASHRSVDRA